MKSVYRTSGTCASKIELNIEDGTVLDVRFIGGCDGNLQGLSSLVRGMRADEAVRRLSGIRCGHRSTSCPDQLARALESALKTNEN